MSRSEDTSSPFTTVSNVEVSRREKYQRILKRSVWSPLRIFLADWRGKVGTTIVVLYVFAGTVGTEIVPPPHSGQAPRSLGPFQSLEFVLGSDPTGKGILNLLVHGTPIMLKMILAGAVFTVCVATVMGIVAGYKGGVVDSVLSTVMDIALTIPGLPLVIVLVVLFSPNNVFIIGIILAINAWAGLARSIRSQVLTIREESYVEASRAMGISLPTILLEDILPNILSYVFINFVLAGRRIIFSSVALYYLGILPLIQSHWGVILKNAYSSGALYAPAKRYWLFFPIVTIVLLSYGLFLLAQSADRMFNARLRAKHAEHASEHTE